jgi:chemotaxis protein MotB
MKTSMQPIIVRKKKSSANAHHSGAWKVAFADFTTAMMAFFLLLWLVAAANEPQKKAIAGYFNDVGGGLIGPGGANSGAIQLEHPLSQSDPMTPPAIRQNEAGGDSELPNRSEGAGAPAPVALSAADIRKQYEKKEQESLEQLKQKLDRELDKPNSPFAALKDQILIDYTGLGLRVQIVDKEQRPMFDLGSARLKNYTEAVLAALAPLLNQVENHISITGHTDAISYGTGAVYSNWELSADRANSARRALLNGGYPEQKVVTVQGMGASAPFAPATPNAPVNRRIAIIVLKKSVEEALLGKQGIGSDHIIDSKGDALTSSAK